MFSWPLSFLLLLLDVYSLEYRIQLKLFVVYSILDNYNSVFAIVLWSEPVGNVVSSNQTRTRKVFILNATQLFYSIPHTRALLLLTRAHAHTGAPLFYTTGNKEGFYPISSPEFSGSSISGGSQGRTLGTRKN